MRVAAIIFVTASWAHQILGQFEARLFDGLSRRMDFRQKELMDRIEVLSSRMTRLREEQEFQRTVLDNLCVGLERRELV